MGAPRPTVALKVDVDTFCGTRDGVPRLLELLQRFGVRATFYFSLGPDNSGRAIRRIFHRGFLRKMLRTGAPGIYGFRTLVHGTLLPGPMIAERFPDLLRSVSQAGHEVGIHAWDHVEWHDRLHLFSRQKTLQELQRADAAFLAVFGRAATTTAAPGWTVSADSLDIQESMGLSYCSDSRGTAPFYPVFQGRQFETLQIPSTWPTMDELLGRDGITAAGINQVFLQRLRPGLNVHTIHAELEGNVFRNLFSDLLERLAKLNVRFVTLAEAAEEAGGNAPRHELRMEYVRGRAMPVALQAEPRLPLN